MKSEISLVALLTLLIHASCHFTAYYLHHLICLHNASRLVVMLIAACFARVVIMMLIVRFFLNNTVNNNIMQ